MLKLQQTMNLMKHLGLLRESYKVPPGKHSPKSTSSPPPLRTRPLVTNISPAMARIARAPNFPEILEEEEQDDGAAPQARRKSSSRLPVPSRQSLSPPPVEVEEPPTKAKKKPARRQSGMIKSCESPPPRPSSAEVPPAVEEQDDGFPVFREDDDVEIEVPKKKKKSKRREREEENVMLVIEGSTSRLKDVTNSPQSRGFLPPLDTNFSTGTSMLLPFC